MALALYDVTAAPLINTLEAVSSILDKGLAHCREAGIDPETIVESWIHPEMLPFRFQITSVAHHSQGAIEAVRNGRFGLPPDRGALDYKALQGLIADALADLQRLDPTELNALEGSTLVFKAGDFSRNFTAERFLLSLSLPNVYFHATTAYAILRASGAPIGKRDFLGALPFKS